MNKDLDCEIEKLGFLYAISHFIKKPLDYEIILQINLTFFHDLLKL